MMYPHSRPTHNYPVATPPQPRPNPGLPPPPQLQDTSAMMHHMPAHNQQNLARHQPGPPQHLPPPPQSNDPSLAGQVSFHQTPGMPGDWCGKRDGRSYRLSVEQQPVRARMCGFGDKDRRPITPPPCIRLVVCDAETGREIDFNDVDSTFFVLQVDLWHEDATRAVNLVRHSSSQPTVSISSSTMTSYPPVPDRPMYMATAPMLSQPWDGMSRPVGSQAIPHNFAFNPSLPESYSNGSRPTYPQYNAQNGGYPQAAQPPMPIAVAAPTVAQNHTRNLIGMNAVNACRLNDPDGKTGFWFVLQDLSVRTEGTFRLKLSMCDIGTGQGTNATVSSGKCPVLASTFSEPFTVYSAKKFPGVIESTPLSKCFAQQGIKIPIRKDGPKPLSNQAEYDNDDV